MAEQQQSLLGGVQRSAQGQQASPEEQQQYEQAVEYLEKLVTAEAAYERYAEMIMGSESLEQGLGQVAAHILVRIETKVGISEAVRSQLLDDILPEVFELAEEMGLIDESQVTEAMIKKVVARGTEAYAILREQSGNPIKGEEKVQELSQLQQSGEIDEALSELPEDEAQDARRMLEMVNKGKPNG